MSRPFSPAKLRKRVVYRGYDYGTSAEVKLRGSEWRERIAGLRVEHNGDCIAVYSGAVLQLEIYPD